MKRRLILNALLSLTIVIAGITSSSCGPSTGDANVKPSNNSGGQPPTPAPGDATAAEGPQSDLGDIATGDTAMILRVERDVSLKAKGATEFVRILSGMFHGGDTLQVGDQSKAWVSCRDGSICPLGTGLYSECCKDVCETGIRIPPPANSESQSRSVFIKKSELPPVELQAFELQEDRIRHLGADEVTTQFLIADLYSSWKLVEANDALKSLSQQLNKPEAQQELKALYAPMLRKTGDMQLRIKKTADAEDSYKKAVEVAPGTNDSRDRAAAHVSLGEFYEKNGMKEKAVGHLEKSEQIYKAEGEPTKAAATHRAIVKLQNQ